MSKKQYKKTIARILRDDAYKFFKDNYENNVTCSAYIRNYNRFISFCRETHNCKSKEQCKEHIKDYIEYLTEKGLSPSTIHTYVAPVVLYHGESLNDYELPKRIVAHNTRSRNERKTYCKNADPDNPEFARLVEFQRCVGLRRDELARLRKNDFVLTRDEMKNKIDLHKIRALHAQDMYKYYCTGWKPSRIIVMF